MSKLRCRLYERTIALHAGGDLPRLGRWLADRHLASCPQCRAAMDRYEELRGTLAKGWPVPKIDFDALGHRVRAAAAQSGPERGPQAHWRWPAAIGAAAAAAAIAVLWLAPGSNAPQSDPRLTSALVPAATTELGLPAGADVELTSAGSLRVQSFHVGSSTLTITDYYAP